MWIDSIGTPIGVQQTLMRHSDIRTTMNIYGDAASEDMREEHGKIVRTRAANGVNGTETARERVYPTERMAPQVGLESTLKRSFNTMQVSG